MNKKKDDLGLSARLCYNDLGRYINQISSQYLPTVMIQALLQICAELAYHHKTIPLDKVKKKLNKQMDWMMDYFHKLDQENKETKQ